MSRTWIDRRVLTDPSWWHWAATVPLLAAHLMGVRGAIVAALVLCAVMAGYYRLRVGGWRPLPAQARLVYFGALLFGLLPGMGWLYAVALAGTAARVLVGYCLLTRTLGLLPFNRSEPFGVRLVWGQVVAAPAGGLFSMRRREAAPSPAACSLADRTTLVASAPVFR